MKGVFVILDGVADLSCIQLNGKTPLEAARTPNLDQIAKKSKIGHCYTVKEGVIPSSDTGVISLFGYDYLDEKRGPLEAMGLGIKLRNGDLAFRCNFATMESIETQKIIDRRGGRTLSNKEARELAKAINKGVKLPFKFEFFSSVQHRGVLVIRGGFSDNITEVEIGKDNKFEFAKPLDDEEDSRLSAELINSFVRQSYKILENHPVNLVRAKKGLFVANVILCRGVGSEPLRLKKLTGRWIGLGYMPLEIGISRALGMNVYRFRYPKLKGIDAYENLYHGLNKAMKYAKRMLKWKKNKYDYLYVHLKEPDIPGHDNKPLDKVRMIELIDEKFFSFLNDYSGDGKIIITADHTTACRKYAHSDEPVPVLIYDGEKIDDKEKRFTEEEGMKGKKIVSRKLLGSYMFGK